MRQKTIEIGQAELALKSFIASLLDESFDPLGPVAQDFGSWQEIANGLHYAYKTGCQGGKARAMGKAMVETMIDMLKTKDGNFRYLLETAIKAVTTELGEINIDAMPPLPSIARFSEKEIKDAQHWREWIDRYMEWSDYWSPRGHPLMAEAIACYLLSLIAAGRIVIPIDEGVHTHLYVMLAAKTSKYAKTYTVNKGRFLLRSIGLDRLLMEGTSTPEALYKIAAAVIPSNWDDMSEEEQEQYKGHLIFAGKRGKVFDEFGAQLQGLAQPQGPMKGFHRLFLYWYDDLPEDSTHTIARGGEKVEKPYLALLTSLSIDNVQNLPKGINLHQDGFFARFAQITPPKNEWNMREAPAESIWAPKELTEPLIQFHRRLEIPRIEAINEIISSKGKPTGRYKVHRSQYPEHVCIIGNGVAEAKARYNNALLTIVNTEGLIPEDLHGNYIRLSLMAYKVAALLAWLTNSGRIELGHWIVAQGITENWRKGSHEFYTQVQGNDSSSGNKIEKRILRYLDNEKVRKRGGLRANEIQGRLGALSSKQVLEHLESMVNIGSVVKHSVPGGKSRTQMVTVYGLPDYEEFDEAEQEVEDKKKA